MIWLVAGFFGLGIFFAVVGNIGVLRFPDVYTRIHASSKCSTTAVISVIIACLILKGLSAMSLRILVIAFFFLLTAPVTSHIIGRRAWKRGVLPWRKRGRAEK